MTDEEDELPVDPYARLAAIEDLDDQQRRNQLYLLFCLAYYYFFVQQKPTRRVKATVSEILNTCAAW